MKRRKHRIVVELTTSQPLTERDATLAMKRLLERIDLQAQPIWDNALNIYAEKVQAKAFSKVLGAEKRALEE